VKVQHEQDDSKLRREAKSRHLRCSFKNIKPYIETTAWSWVKWALLVEKMMMIPDEITKRHDLSLK
jgi:hypothetical protein